MDFDPTVPPPGMMQGAEGVPGMMPMSTTGVTGMGAVPPGHQAAAMMGYQQQQQHQQQHQQQEDLAYRPPQGEFAEVKNVVIDGGDRFIPCSLAFDDQEELLWMGNSGGHVTSYYSMEMQKYSSFQVHQAAEIRHIHPMSGVLYCICNDSVRCWTKFGMPQYIHQSENIQNLQCMLQTQPTSILLGGHQPMMVEFDINTRQEVRVAKIGDPGCAILRYSNHFICAGDTSGKVTLRDPNTLNAVQTLEAHSGTLSDFDVHSNQLVTCGFSNSRMGNLSVDRFLMIYDLRMMRAMTPMQTTIDPAFLRFVPTYSNRICVVSQSGQFQVMEQGAMTANSLLMYQVNNEGAPIASFDISSSCQTLAFGDSGGYLHLFATQDQSPVYNTYSTPTEFAHLEPPPQSINYLDEVTPFSMIPMEYPQNGQLASNWPQEMSRRIYRKPPKVNPEILRSMKMVGSVGYAPNPGVGHRNQMPYTDSSNQGQSGSSYRGDKSSAVPESPVGRGEDPFVKVPKRYQKVEIKYSKLGVEDFDFRFYNKTNFAGLETHIPNAYCNAMLQVLYFIEPLRCTLLGHMCQKEFCLSCELGFLFHMMDIQKGKTCQGSNFLRAFRTIPEASALGLVLGDAEESMGKANLQRLIQNWSRFIMQQIHTELVIADNPNLNVLQGVQGENAPSGAAMDKSKASDTGATDAQPDGSHADNIGPQPGLQQRPNTDSSESIINKIFGMELENRFKCRCGEIQSRQMTSTIIDLQYPDVLQGSTKAQGPQQFPFSQIVERSISPDQPTQAWCNKCEKYQPHLQSKIIKSLPDILSLNCHLENSRDFEYWKVQEELLRKHDDVDASLILQNAMTASRSNIKMCRYGNGCKRADCKFRHDKDIQEMSQVQKDKLIDEWAMDRSWVPFGLKLELTPEGRVAVQNIPDENMIPDTWDNPNIMYYELFSTVAHIGDPKTGGNLISNVFVGEEFHKRKERVTCTQWYLFNDFSITPLDKKEEAVHFNLDWKVPCSVFYTRKNLNRRHRVEVVNPIVQDILLTNKSMVNTPRRKTNTFTPLGDDEIPVKGALVGLDAEFVTLNQEEAELRSDGTRSMLKPSQLSVARITCVRGCDGALTGEPFIDDYISTSEQVVDYLTQFSGIQPGDLDASISSKHLTSLKSTYKKLRYLVDVGVIFVGHGLKKDFRVINLNVPKEQVYDTVELFHLPRQRMISLKFLAWYFLDINIQSEMHDSIEDARTALQLYVKYKEIASEGGDELRKKLKQMYERGYNLQWKIPSAKGGEEEAEISGFEDLSLKEGMNEESSTLQDLM